MKDVQRKRTLVLAMISGLMVVPTLMGTSTKCVLVPVEGLCDPAAWLDCPEDLVCVANSIDEIGSCYRLNVGAGYTCGGSTAIGCADGLQCEGLLEPSIIGGMGICTPLSTDGCNAAAWLDCGEELICVTNSIDEPGECLPFDYSQSVGAGYTCSGSIGASCADGLECKGMPEPPFPGSGGICVLPSVEICDPAAWLDCGEELVCVANSVDELGGCLPFDHGQSVGAGYTCGGSIGVACADGLECEGLSEPPLIGGTGICRF